jgi:acetyltransferase-like isoleucine patch superfamily enzyme
MKSDTMRLIRRKLANLVRDVRRSYYRSLGVEIGTGGMISVDARLDTHKGKIIIGNGVGISSGCQILSHSQMIGRIHHGRPSVLITVIEDNVIMGVNSVILPGVRIGTLAIIGAGSVVTKDVPPYAVVAGNPARVIRYLKKPEEKKPEELSE